MIFFIMRILKLVIILFIFLSAKAVATVIEDIKVKNNNRISKETIMTYGAIELKKDYNNDDINQILKNLYETNFFEDIEITIVGNILNIKLIDDKAKKVISDFSAQFSKIDNLTRESLEPKINGLIESHNTNFKGVGQPLRIALTGSKFGPGIYDIIISLGKEEVSKRLSNKIFA